MPTLFDIFDIWKAGYDDENFIEVKYFAIWFGDVGAFAAYGRASGFS